jgi:hypothetical protein
VSLVDAILLPIIVVGLSYMVFRDLRYTFRKRASQNWPSVEATIDSGIVGFKGPLSALPSLLYRVHFTYSYNVGGARHSGHFFLLADSRKSGEEFRQALAGKKILAKYDSRQPAVSLLIDQEMMGRRVMQGPSWTYRAGGTR